MPLDWSDPKPSNREYLKDILLGYLERYMSAQYYASLSSVGALSGGVRELRHPFTAAEWQTLADNLIAEPANGGSCAALADSANILLKNLAAANGLSAYYSDLSLDNIPALWVWTGNDWNLQTPNGNYGNPLTGAALSSGVMAKSARWITDKIDKGICLDGETAKEIWLSMRRAVQSAKNLCVEGGKSSSYEELYGCDILGSYAIGADGHFGAAAYAWPDGDGNPVEYTSAQEAWDYLKEHWQDGGGYWWGRAGNYSQFTWWGDWGHTQTLEGRATRDVEWGPDGTIYSDRTEYGVGYELGKMEFGAFFPYTSNPEALVNIPPPGSLKYAFAPVISPNVNLADQNTIPSAVEFQAWGDWAPCISSERWKFVEVLGSVGFNQRVERDSFGDYGNLAQMPGGMEPPTPPFDPTDQSHLLMPYHSRTSTLKRIGWITAYGSPVGMLAAPAFEHCP